MSNIYDRFSPETLANIPADSVGNLNSMTAKEQSEGRMKRCEGAYDRLCNVLFEGESKVSQVNVTLGTNSANNFDFIAQEMLDSMKRMGLVKEGKLFNPN